MQRKSSPICQVIAACAMIGCVVFGGVALIAVNRARTADERWNAIKEMPGMARLADDLTQAKRENSDRWRTFQETVQSLPNNMQQRRVSDFQLKLSNVQERMKLPLSEQELQALTDITNVLTEAHELEVTPFGPASSSRESINERVAARMALSEMRQRYIELRLELLAGEYGYSSVAEKRRFTTAVSKLYADADAMVGHFPAPPSPRSPTKGSR